MLDTFSRDFERVGGGLWRVYTHRDYKLKFVGGDDPEKWFEGIEGPFETVQSSVGANVLRCQATIDGKKYGVYLKEYFCRSVKDAIKNLVRPGRAMRGYIGSSVLSSSGLKVPETIAIGEKRYGPVLVKEFAVTLEAVEAKSVYWWLRHRAGDRSRFVMELGDAVGRMHKANICHGDLRPGNILADRSEEGFEFYFLDNERTCQPGKLSWNLRKKNLVQMNMLRGDLVSRTDRLRFFKSYMAHNAKAVGEWKSLASEVAVRTGERLEKIDCTN